MSAFEYSYIHCALCMCNFINVWWSRQNQWCVEHLFTVDCFVIMKHMNWFSLETIQKESRKWVFFFLFSQENAFNIKHFIVHCYEHHLNCHHWAISGCDNFHLFSNAFEWRELSLNNSSRYVCCDIIEYLASNLDMHKMK